MVAILGTLAAIVFPVFNRTRCDESSWSCRSKLKLIGAALNAYAADYDGRLPNRD